MKKNLVFVAALSALFLLSGCGASEDSGGGDGGGPGAKVGIDANVTVIGSTKRLEIGFDFSDFYDQHGVEMEVASRSSSMGYGSYNSMSTWIERKTHIVCEARSLVTASSNGQVWCWTRSLVDGVWVDGAYASGETLYDANITLDVKAFVYPNSGATMLGTNTAVFTVDAETLEFSGSLLD